MTSPTHKGPQQSPPPNGAAGAISTAGQTKPTAVAPQKARVFLKRVTFSDGTLVDLDPQSLVVICGPNNAGKSAALRETLNAANHRVSGLVVKSVDLVFEYKKDQLMQYISENSIRTARGGVVNFSGLKFRVTETSISMAFTMGDGNPKELSFIDGLFTNIATTENRLKDSDPARSIAIIKEAPTHPIHVLQDNPSLLDRMSSYFHRAFGTDLTIHFGAGGEVPLYVGPRVDLLPGEHPMSRSYLQRLEEISVRLEEQGDGMRSFVSVMMAAIAQRTSTMIFIDEPEAFLHPPQARLLGEFLSEVRRPGVQTFLATHSAALLDGILRTTNEDVTVLRIDRFGDRNRISALDRNIAKEISAEPLTRYSNILDGIFHKHVVVCESDTDSAFYNATLDAISPDIRVDVMFTHGNGKASLAKITRALSSLGVPTSAIVDIDILNDPTSFNSLYSSLGGDWGSIQSTFTRFKKSVETQKNFLKVGDVKKEVKDALDSLGENDPLTLTARRKIADAIAQTSPWENLKLSGRMAVRDGQMIKDFDFLLKSAADVRLWIVPVGELESFCRMGFGGHGPAWLRNVLENFVLGSAPELQPARAFVSDVARAIGVAGNSKS